MARPRATVRTIRVSVYLYPEVAAQLSLACADTSFGGTKYGEQTRLVNLALQQYFKGVSPCMTQKPLVESISSEQPRAVGA